MRSVRRYLGSLNPQLPRSVLTLQLGGLFNFVGNGMAIPFLFIYLHNVRGIGLDTAGLILATGGAASIVVTPFAGALADRIGGRPTLAAALVLLAAGYCGYAFIDEPWQAFAAAAVAGSGSGAFWPAQSTLIAGLTPRDRRHAAFALQRVTMNLGFGLGGLTGGLIATTSRPGTFTLIFLLNALTFFLYIGALAFVPDPARGRSRRAASGGRYVDVLRHRVFVGVVTLNLVFITALAQIEAFPVYAKNEANVSERMIGLIFLVNSLVVVFAQLPVAKLLEGHRRMPALAALGVLWTLAWLLFPIAGVLFAGVAAALVFVAAVVVFGIGECLHGAVHPALVADLAREDAIGRYMASSSASWQIGFTLAPAIAGFMLDAWPHGLWFVTAALSLGGGMAALVLERALPRHALRTPHASARVAAAEA